MIIDTLQLMETRDVKPFKTALKMMETKDVKPFKIT
jgi:hypothetical protein